MGVVYTIIYNKHVLTDDIPALGNVVKKRIQQSIEQKLTTHPDLYGKPLRGSARGNWKLRVGDYRVVYQIEKQTVKIFLIAHRAVVYEKMKKR